MSGMAGGRPFDRMPGGIPRSPEGPRRRMRWPMMAEKEGKSKESPWPEDKDGDYYPYGDGAYPEPGEGGPLGDEGPHE